MVRTATKSHHQEVEDDDGDDFAADADASSQRDGKSIEQKVNNSRSKHSETEQRRRSKINERFQILKDLIPPNDQKRDKASLLLEVIEYIQFLQEKLNMYEGSYQGWNQEPAKLVPWTIRWSLSNEKRRESLKLTDLNIEMLSRFRRSNHGHGESFSVHPQVMKNGSEQENYPVQPITNASSSVEPGFTGDAGCRGIEHPSVAATSAVPLSMPLQPSIYPPGRSALPTENLASQPLSQALLGGPLMEHAISGNPPSETGTTNISSVYSQGLLRSLTQAFQTSGVDLSQASISVQLDVGKRPNVSPTAARPTTEDIGKVSPSNKSVAHLVPQGDTEDSNPPAKRSRKGES